MSAIVTAITGSAVSLIDAKNYLKIDGNEDDGLIVRLINAAISAVMTETGYALGNMTVVQTWTCMPCARYLELDFSPVSGITAFEYINSEGVWTAWDEGNWQTAMGLRPVRIGPKPNFLWPTIQSGALESLKVTYTVNSPAAGDLLAPDALRQAVMLLVAYWYENREDVALGKTDMQTARAWRALCAPWRNLVI